MIKIDEIIQEYEEHKLSLEYLQDIIWGLSENTLDSLSNEQIKYYLLK